MTAGTGVAADTTTMATTNEGRTAGTTLPAGTAGTAVA